jgi:hypothetical protein
LGLLDRRYRFTHGGLITDIGSLDAAASLAESLDRP